MKYLMRSGALLNEAGALVCRLQRFPLSTQKQIYHSNGTLALQVEIRQKQTTPENRDQAWHHDYIMASPQGDSIIRAQPDYAQGEDPRQIGWPLCRMPRVDHADISLNREQYRLVMLGPPLWLRSFLPLLLVWAI